MPIDDRMMFSTGWTPPVEKICIRCGKKHMSQLVMICFECRAKERIAEHQAEIDHKWELLREMRKEMREEEDCREDTIHLGRYGF